MKTLLLTSALSVVAASAIAQDMTFGNATFSYSSFSEGGDSLDTLGLRSEFGFQTGAFSYGATLDYVDLSGDGPSFSLTGLTVDGAYAFAPGWSAGAAYTTLRFGGGGGPSDDTASIYEVFGLYDTGTFFARAAYVDGEDFFFGEETAAIGIAGGYNFGQGTEAALSVVFDTDDSENRVSVLQVRHDTDMMQVDFTYFDISGPGPDFFDLGVAYAVTPQIDLLFDYRDFTGEANTYAVGGAYEFTDGVSAYAKYSQLDIEGQNVDGFSVGITYDMGDKPLSQQNTYDRVIRPLYFDTDGFPFVL